MRKGLVPQSVWWRLILGFIGVSCVGAIGTGYFIFDRFVTTTSAFRDRTLQNDANVMGKLLSRTAEGKKLNFPDFLADNFQNGRGKYAIVSDNGVLIAGSPGVTEPLAPLDEAKHRDFFLSDNDHDGRMLYGYTLKSSFGDRPVFIQVAVPSGELAFDSVLEEFIEDVGWIWLPILGGLLAVNLIVVRVGLRPLRVAAKRANAIGPHAVSSRLPEGGLPQEVHALVRAVNLAFDRLEAGYESQKTFIADAAHELRTPVAVLKAHAALLPESGDIVKLRLEIGALERLVNQLLDSARLDAIILEEGDTAELTSVAVAVAHQLGPLAVNSGKSIEVIAPAPVVIGGSADWIFCAVRNLAENALRHTPPGTAVEITVETSGRVSVRDYGPGISSTEREAVFRRFWQGNRDRGCGAGLGLDIVRRVVDAHAGFVCVEDTLGAGATFVIQIPVHRSGKENLTAPQPLHLVEARGQVF
jgi:signal transduction histidine kinase